MQEHAELGERLLAHVPLLNQEGARVIRSHHERWDGNGYPDRLSEESIPLGARIFAVVDSLDAMTDQRPYRAPVSWEAAAEEIRRCRGRTSTRTSSTASRHASPTSTACTWRSSRQPDGAREGGLHDRPPS
jgi:HD-GYP domain-containing protein (c-di-GMP phosphodiesterase class II)